MTEAAVVKKHMKQPQRTFGWIIAVILLMSSYTYSIAQEKTTANHGLWNQLLQKHVDAEGWVDYEGFQRDWVLLNGYLRELSKNPPKKTQDKTILLAYYINLYNAYTIALILREYPVESIKEIQNPWTEKFIPIREQWFSLNDIEHDILRKMNEPRIHFAINCASISCPKLLNAAYVANRLEEQLSQVTKSFINGKENRLDTQPIRLSRIFKWYRSDFEINGKMDLIGFINTYSDIKIPSDEKIKFLDYNWKLNKRP